MNESHRNVSSILLMEKKKPTFQIRQVYLLLLIKINTFLTTNSLIHQDGDCVIECKMSWRQEKVKVLCNLTAEAILCNRNPTALHS